MMGPMQPAPSQPTRGHLPGPQPFVLAPYRPATIFAAEDPTLDPFAITHASPPPDRRLARALSLGIYGLLLAAWIVLPRWLGGSREGGGLRPPEPLRKLDVVLEPLAMGPRIPKPKEGPSGGGQGGTGSLDPRLAVTDVPMPAPKVINPEAAEYLVPATPSLPLAPGGDGLGKGHGPGSGGGTGGGTGSGSGFKRPLDPDYQLVAINRVEPVYQLAPGQTQAPCIVTVAIVIEADGHVSQAHAVSGPAFLGPAAVAAAKAWTFEPLAPHGLTAPFRMKLNFHYKPPKG